MAGVICLLALLVFAPPVIREPLRLTEFEVTHFDRSGGRPKNVGRVDAPGAGPVQFGDSIRVRAEFDRPAHVALLTLDADGGVELRPLVDPNAAAPAESFTYPAGSRVYTLNDAEGLQALLLLASSRPLSSPDRWVNEARKRWHETDATGVWRFDGRDFELASDGERGEEESVGPLPTPFSDVCEWSRTLPDVDVVQGFAFPIVGRGSE
jgi:hypothetical protein